MKQYIKSAVCLFCFGAKGLTRDGKLFTACPVCKGGEIVDEKLEIANKKYLMEIENDNFINEENEYYNKS